MERFKVTSKHSWEKTEYGLEETLVHAMKNRRDDTIDEMRAEICELQETVARLIIALYANGNSPTGFKIGLKEEQINEICLNAEIGKITPA